MLGVAEGEAAYTGIGGLRTSAEEVDAVWEDWHQEVVDYREVGKGQAAAIIRAKGSGVPLDTFTGNVLTRRHGKGGGTRRTPIRARPSKPWGLAE